MYRIILFILLNTTNVNTNIGGAGRHGSQKFREVCHPKAKGIIYSIKVQVLSVKEHYNDYAGRYFEEL